MPHYAYCLSLKRLSLMAHIGFYEQERNELQEIEVSFRLYFEEAIACNHDDSAAFFNYGVLADHLRSVAISQKFNLIEYMSMAMFRHLRAEIDAMGGEKARLWLELDKIHAPVPGLKGGASFTYSDLPADATFIPGIAP